MGLRNSIGANIKQFRLKKGLSQDELASGLFVTRQTVSNYETGRSAPDIDMLQQIAQVLETDLTCLLYGPPREPRPRGGGRETWLLLALSALALAATILLYRHTQALMLRTYGVAPHMLVRLVLAPLTAGLLGASLLQVIHHFFGIRRPSGKVRKIGGRVTLALLLTALAIVLPYLLWLLSILLRQLAETGRIEAVFPHVPVYTKAAFFLLGILYRAPAVCALPGMALWLFCGRHDTIS